MSKGHPDSRTCPNCKDECFAGWNFCPMCGADLWKRPKKTKTKPTPPEGKAND